VVSIVEEWKDLASDQVKKRNTIRLTSSTHKDLDWISRFHGDAQQYLDAHTKSMAACYRAMRARTVQACRGTRADARALLVTGRQRAELETFRELYDAAIKTHDGDEAWMVDSVKKCSEFLIAAAEFPTTWQAKSFDGSTFRLADHRGKVVVLYFWTTTCEYCVLAAPQVRQLAAEYQGKDAAVVGMFVSTESIDDDESRAKSFIAKTYQGFPHVEADDVVALYRLQQYGLDGYPSILVLDHAGRVHEVFVGYAADKVDRIRKVVDDLRSRPDRQPPAPPGGRPDRQPPASPGGSS